MTKPKYEELSSEQVNDLIATKVMGWYRDGSSTLWRDDKGGYHKIRYYENMRMDYAPDDQPDSDDIFNPASNLNDCWLAEEKLREKEENRRYTTYIVRLTELGGVAKAVHATAADRSRALLLAIGEISE